MEDRYVVGLAKGVNSCITDRNPGFFPIVDMKTPFVFGMVALLADTKEIADRVCALLNAAEPPSD